MRELEIIKNEQIKVIERENKNKDKKIESLSDEVKSLLLRIENEKTNY